MRMRSKVMIPSYYIHNVAYPDYILTVTTIVTTIWFHSAVNMAPFTIIKIAKL